MQELVFDGSGLEADPAILAHVTEVLNALGLDALDDAYFALIAEGEQRYTAARTVGLDPIRVYRRLKMDERFAERMRVADAEAMEPVVASLREAAIQNGDARSAIKLIESKNSEEYGAKPQQIDINVNNTSEFAGMNPVLRRIRELEAEIIHTKELTSGKDKSDG